LGQDPGRTGSELALSGRLNIGLESRAVRLREDAARLLRSTAAWLIIPLLLGLLALFTHAGATAAEAFAATYPHIAREVPDDSAPGIFLVVLSVVVPLATLLLSSLLAARIVERLARSRYRRALRWLHEGAGRALASQDLWDRLSALFNEHHLRRYIGPRPVTLEQQLALSAAWLPLAADPDGLASPRLLGHLRRGLQLWLAQLPPGRRANAWAGWLLLGVGLPCAVALTIAQPWLGLAAGAAFAVTGLSQVALLATYCGYLMAVCDFFREEESSRLL
jgi:hypothetical protein